MTVIAARAVRGLAVCNHRRGLVAGGLVALVLMLPDYSRAETTDHFEMEQQSRQEAIAAIPFDRLNEAAQAKLHGLVTRPAIYRRLPASVIKSDPDLYLFLVRYPEVIVNMWQLMGVTKVQIQRTGDYTFDAADGAGTTCQVELLYGDRNVHVYYAEGSYEGPLLRRLIRGSCVLVLRSSYAPTNANEVFVTNQLDMFVKFDNVGAEILARTLHPLVGNAADHNFTESTRFLGQVADAAEKRSAGLQHLAARLTNVDVEIRDAFSEIAATANHRAAMRQAATDDTTVTASTPVTISIPAVVEGASSLFDTDPHHKPLRLRR